MSGQTVYLLEDCESDALAFSRAIRKLAPGTEVVRWRQAQTAIQAMDSGLPAPDLFFIDLNLPGMNGLEFLRRLRSNSAWQFVPTVVLTSSASPDDVRSSYREGAGGHIVKPQAFDNLVALLGKCLTYWFEAVLRPNRA